MLLQVKEVWSAMMNLRVLHSCLFFVASTFSINLEGVNLSLSENGQSQIFAEPKDFFGSESSDNVYYTHLGGASVFFYMTSEKKALARQFVTDVNENMTLAIGHDSPSDVSKVMLLSSKFPSMGDEFRDLDHTDPSGRMLLNGYVEKTKNIIEDRFGFNVTALSCEIELTTNYDAIKIHQDRLVRQCEFLASAFSSISSASRYCLFQDLTLIDWQMAKGTFASTMVQDGNSGDRFLLILHPGEVFGTIFTQAVDKNDILFSSDHLFFPPHASVAPTDFEGDKTVGTWKGKKINTAVMGVILEEEVNKAEANATFLPINRPERKSYGNGLKSVEYPNGIVIKELPHSLIDNQSRLVRKLEDQENVTILKMSPGEYREEGRLFNEMFDLKGCLTNVYRLIKKDRGFSRFDRMQLPIFPSSTVVIVNRSQLPKGYKYFNFSEDCTRCGKPWIHLYEVAQENAMLIPAEVLENCSMTSLEELFYRNEVDEAESSGIPSLKEKLIAEFDVFILN